MLTNHILDLWFTDELEPTACNAASCGGNVQPGLVCRTGEAGCHTARCPGNPVAALHGVSRSSAPGGGVEPAGSEVALEGWQVGPGGDRENGNGSPAGCRPESGPGTIRCSEEAVAGPGSGIGESPEKTVPLGKARTGIFGTDRPFPARRSPGTNRQEHPLEKGCRVFWPGCSQDHGGTRFAERNAQNRRSLARRHRPTPGRRPGRQFSQ